MRYILKQPEFKKKEGHAVPMPHSGSGQDECRRETTGLDLADCREVAAVGDAAHPVARGVHAGIVNGDDSLQCFDDLLGHWPATVAEANCDGAASSAGIDADSATTDERAHVKARPLGKLEILGLISW